MSSYSHKSALDELRAKRPATQRAKHVCWLPQNNNDIRHGEIIQFDRYSSLRATCSNSESVCNERIQRAAQHAHGDYAAQYRLDRVP